ncbi:hypothetical protein [Lactococcus taiwanensis]|uniref:hypothetical protein n=1 Tax=Lactococcus taiwanensis TaxID=1151742 RepID=UPI001963948F|nr:hypothetical protein [Lactococcus taiwanensis]QRZ11589.1 hypothetical protein JVB21_02795 [Lactococcus taiwanensis]
MSRVDRSYSKYESIRTYEDRGKMKWNPFATAELASAHREYHSDFIFEEPGFSLEEDEIKTMLSFAKSLRLPIAIEYQAEKQKLNVSGIVIDWMEDYHLGIILQKEDGHYQEIAFKSITRVSDDQYFEDYLNQ